jgi:hypothetical protein
VGSDPGPAVGVSEQIRAALTAAESRELGPLYSALAGMVAGLDELDLRRLRIATLAGRPLIRCGISALLAIDALQECAATAVYPDSLDTFDRWRLSQARPEDWPPGSFIADIFRGRWSTALEEAGIELRGRLAFCTQGAYSREDLASAIHRWIEETIATAAAADDPASALSLRQRAAAFRSANLTQGAYLVWARRTRCIEPESRIPTHPSYPIKLFGGWRQAVDAAHPEACAIWKAVEERAAASRAERERIMLRHLRLAADTWTESVDVTARPQGRRPRFTRKVYDAWATDYWATHGNRGGADAPRRSKNVIVHFGTWSAALNAAGVSHL